MWGSPVFGLGVDLLVVGRREARRRAHTDGLIGRRRKTAGPIAQGKRRKLLARDIRRHDLERGRLSDASRRRRIGLLEAIPEVLPWFGDLELELEPVGIAEDLVTVEAINPTVDAADMCGIWVGDRVPRLVDAARQGPPHAILAHPVLDLRGGP